MNSEAPDNIDTQESEPTKLLDISPADLAELSPKQKQRVFKAIGEIEESLATAEQNAKGKKIVDQLTAPERALFHGCWLLRETTRTAFQKLPGKVKELFGSLQNRFYNEENTKTKKHSRVELTTTLEGREAA